MRGCNQVFLMYGEIPDRCRGQIALQELPISTIVEGEEHSFFRAGIEQAFALAIFSYGMNISPRGNASDQRGPGLAKVGGLEDVGSKVIHLVALHGNVGGP